MNNSKRIYFQTGPVIYEICSDRSIEVDSFCEQYFFQIDDSLASLGAEESKVIRCRVCAVDQFSPDDREALYRTPDLLVLGRDGLETRVHGRGGEALAIYTEISETEVRIELKSEEDFLLLDMGFLELLALERHLLGHDSLVLHSSFIQYEGNGILFTAPSGTGKSTQAELWRRYAGAEVINGDRSIIQYDKISNSFQVVGLPFCGSSGINLNRQMPLKSIVFLEQGKENLVEVCDPYKASVKLFGEMSINQWNLDAVNRSLGLIDRLTETVPMFHYSCNMEADACFQLKRWVDQLDK